MIARNKWKTLALSVVTYFAALCQLPCAAEINSDLDDPYLEREYNWAMFIDVRQMKHYFVYPGSRLYPMTQVRINFREYPPDKSAMVPASLFQEYWYHQEVPVGLRQFKPLKVAANKFGTIIVGKVEDNDVGAVSNVLVRLMIHLCLKQVIPSVVLVPREKYYQIAEELARFYFFPEMEATDGPQLSIHLRSYPAGKDEYLFHHGSVR